MRNGFKTMSFLIRSRSLVLHLALFSIVFAGCAGPTKKKPIFFPKSPNPPHVQYLTSFTNGRDLEKDKLFPFLQQNAEKDNVLVKPYGVAVRNGKVYVTDPGMARITVIDLKAKKFIPVNSQALGLRTPTNINLDEEGNLYVADPGRKEIVAINTTFTSGKSIGRDLEMKPTDVTAVGNRIYVLDHLNSDLKILEKDTGKLIKSLGRNPDPDKMLSLPTNMIVDEKNGHIYVANQGSGKILKMDLEGNILLSFGGFGDRFGMFARPKGIFVDDAGYIYVVDAGHQVVQIFNQEARLLMFFGERGSSEGTLDLPADIFVTEEKIEYFDQFVDPSFVMEKLIFVTNQTGPRKVSVFAMGHAKEEAPKPVESDKSKEDTPQPK